MTLTDEQIEKAAKAMFLKAHPCNSWSRSYGRDQWRNLARAALEAVMPEGEPVSVPEGWKLVPVEPTPEMASAGFVADDCTAPMDVCRAMLAATPAHPAPEPGELVRLRAENERLREALEWYEGKLSDFWKSNQWGEAARLFLANDSGHRARAALAGGGGDE